METGSRLTVRAYHVTDVAYGEENRVTVDGKLTVCRETAEEKLDLVDPDEIIFKASK